MTEFDDGLGYIAAISLFISFLCGFFVYAFIAIILLVIIIRGFLVATVAAAELYAWLYPRFQLYLSRFLEFVVK